MKKIEIRIPKDAIILTEDEMKSCISRIGSGSGSGSDPDDKCEGEPATVTCYKYGSGSVYSKKTRGCPYISQLVNSVCDELSQEYGIPWDYGRCECD